MKKSLKIVILVFLILSLIGMGLVFGINSYVKSSTEANILELKEVKDKKYDAIIILGAGLSGDGPSPMLKLFMIDCEALDFVDSVERELK